MALGQEWIQVIELNVFLNWQIWLKKMPKNWQLYKVQIMESLGI
jgi:hypothetical protein